MDASANVIRAMWPPSDSSGGPAIDLQTRQRELTEAHHRMREQFDGQLMRPGSATSRDRALLQTIDELGRMRIILRWEPGSRDYKMPGDEGLARCSAEAMSSSADAIGRGGEAPIRRNSLITFVRNIGWFFRSGHKNNSARATPDCATNPRRWIPPEAHGRHGRTHCTTHEDRCWGSCRGTSLRRLGSAVS